MRLEVSKNITHSSYYEKELLNIIKYIEKIMFGKNCHIIFLVKILKEIYSDSTLRNRGL
jgi:hypothetical protein